MYSFGGGGFIVRGLPSLQGKGDLLWGEKKYAVGAFQRINAVSIKAFLISAEKLYSGTRSTN